MNNVDLTNYAIYEPQAASRRDFLRGTVGAGVGLAALNAAAPAFAASSDKKLKVGLVGCGGRGSGAANQALKTGHAGVVLWAMGDAHQDRLDSSVENLKKMHGDRVQVEGRQFVGLDAYEKVIAECDMVILATPPGFRPYHFEAAVNAGKHVFLEKPVAVDAPGIRKVLEVGELADKKGLKVVCGLQRRYQNCYLEAYKQVKEKNIIGDIVGGQVYWNSAGVWVKDRLPGDTELQYQMRNWYYFNWLCGDHIAEQHVHNIDIANWFIGSNPLVAQGMGGRQVRTGKEFGEIYDHHYVEFTYANGVRINSQCRHQKGCFNPVREEFVGTKGYLYLDNGGRCYATDLKGNTIWKYRPTGPDRKDPDPYQVEHDVLQDAIFNNKPHNDTKWVAESTMASIFGRMATYGGKEIKWDDALASKIQLMPEKLTWDTEPPVKPNADGTYPIAIPGETKVI